ncbi:MAG: hypothetical protein KDC87_11705, partial [Planctomycetes bacterium]|nr:hypothetical protein [Planctomycetota bacterium]
LQAGTRDVDLALLWAASGVLRVTVFDQKLIPVAERLIHRDPTERLNVALQVRAERTTPGTRQRITVRTTDELGKPVASVVGLGVSDQAIADMLASTRTGIVDQHMLFADLQKPEQKVALLLADHPDRRRNRDLLLGSSGWRRYAWRDKVDTGALVAAGGPWAKSLPAREGRARAPVVHDSLSAHLGELRALRWAKRRAGEWFALLAFGAVALLLLLGYAHGVFRLGQRIGSPARVWLTGGAIALFLVVLLPLTLTHLAPREFKAVVGWAAAPTATPAPPVMDAFGGEPYLFFDDGEPQDVRARTEALFDAAAPATIAPAEAPEPNDTSDTEARRPAATPSSEEGLVAVNPKPDPSWAYGWAIRSSTYFHSHPQGESRADFAETLCWQPLLITDASGEGAVEFDVSDRITTWNVSADAHGQGRVGQASAKFTSYLPFRLEPSLPDQVTEGDRLRIPIAVVADDAAATSAQVEVLGRGALRITSRGPQTVALRGGRGRVVIDAEVSEAGRDASLVILRGSLGGLSDLVTLPLRVLPRGFPHRLSRAGRTRGAVEVPLQIPDDALAHRTATLRLRLFPSPLANLEQGLEGMLQEPHGCFEQVSSTNYPNVMVLTLLGGSGDDVPAAAQRARTLLASGYAKLKAYEVAGGGFEWWGEKPAHAALTAYGLMQFTDMAKVFEVDAAMVQRTRSWLLAQRDGKGGFTTGGGRYGHFQGGTRELRSSYITQALLYGGTPAAELGREVDALAQRAAQTDNGYELAVATCGLARAGHQGAAAARQRLAKLQGRDGSVPGTVSITGSGKRDLAVETTAFAVLAWLSGAGHTESIERAVRFLEGCRIGAGQFGGTQATVLALQAMCGYAAANVRTVKPGKIVVRIDGAVAHERRVFGDEKHVIDLDLGTALRDAIRTHGAGRRVLQIEVTGGSELPYCVDAGLIAEVPDSRPNCPLGLETSLSRRTVVEGAPVALRAVVENRTATPIANAMVVLGLPAGLHVESRVLDDLKKAQQIAAWELSGQDVVLYLRGLDAHEKREIAVDLIARVPGTTTGPASRTYPYYSGADKHWTAPLQVEVTAERPR